MGSVWREDGNKQENARISFSRGQTEPFHVIGELGGSDTDSVLDVKGSNIRVGSDIQCDVDCAASIARAVALHIRHAGRSVHLGFNRSRNGLFNSLRVGTVIEPRYLNCRRRNIRVLADR